MKNKFDVVIVGAGPAGIFAALELTALKPDYQVALLDMGRRLDQRTCPARLSGKCVNCKPCAIMSGWAGAGAFSDGKLSLSHEVGGNITDYMSEQEAQALIDYADSIYTKFGAPETVHGRNDPKVSEISYEASRHNIHLVRCPVRHMGTEYSASTLQNMYEALAAEKNFTFFDRTAAREIILENGVATGVKAVNADGEEQIFYGGKIVLAPGRGGAEWLAEEAARLGLDTKNNEVDIGVRVEVPNSIMDHLTQHLYEAKLVYYSDTFENRVRTFCMNPGGIVSEEHYEGGIAVVNGHSYHEKARRTQNTNFAMLVSTHFTQPFNAPIRYGNYIAQLGNMLTGGGIMVQRLGDLLQGRRTDLSRLRKSTTMPTLQTAVPGDLSFVLPHRHLTSIIEALRAFDKLAPGLYSKNTLLYGVEVKFYSSKLAVNNQFQSAVPGLYAIGDGAGITRGLMQASVTGVVVARDIAKNA
ncbi:hypothetical protein LJC07_06915 [Christensenellaceae bacterium OttesenSCG-928-L17]|nr:hypothetical protein [Christensenellaceae bacterium OttesenSCG-928-L17]